MNKMKWVLIAVGVVVVVVVTLFVWSGSRLLDMVGNGSVVKTLVTATQVPVVTKVPNSAPAKNADAAVIVVTATGVSNLGTLLGDQPMTPVPGSLIDWDHLAKLDEWREDFGLTGVPVLYAQSGVPNMINLPLLKDQEVFIVPQGTTLIFGAYSATVSFGGSNHYTHSGGFYGAITQGTKVEMVNIQDGFLLLAKDADAKAEYCARIAQAINEKWAHSFLFRPTDWSEPVCEGVITTPLDNDR
jgi:hypothetical protein